MKNVLTCILLITAAAAFSQKKDRDLAKGNNAFDDKEYAKAEADYRISQSKAPTKSAAAYNLGNAIYRQKFAGEALYAYGNAIKNAKTKTEKHMAYHNMGNALMTEKNYQAAVEAYKNALRNNPLDEETRYNYALAKKMLKDNPPPPPPDDKKDDKKDKDKKENKNQQPNNPKDQKDKGGDKDKDKKGKGNDEKKDQGDKGQDKKDKNNGQGNKTPQPSGVSPSKQQMQNLLDAMDNEEKKVQDKMNKTKAKARPVPTEKDW